MSYDNTNTGILYKNDRKNTDKHPDYTGSININGVDHWLSAWIKEGKKGKFMSLSIGAVKQAKQDQHNQDKSNGYQQQGSHGGSPYADEDSMFDSEIPF